MTIRPPCLLFVVTNDEQEAVKEYIEEFNKMLEDTKKFGCSEEEDGCWDNCLDEDSCIDTEDWKKRFKSLEKYSKRKRGGDRKLKTIRKLLNNVYSEDIEMIYELMITKNVRKATVPNLDGLFGGKACKLTNGSKCTSRLQP